MNKKILNATNSAIGNISFKSKLEASVYKTLVEHGFSPQYESQRFVLWKGSKINDIYYTKGSDGHLKADNSKIRDITYTPDFIFKVDNYVIIIEVKGYENDVFPIKKKLFIDLLGTMNNINSVGGEPLYKYFEIFSKRQLLEAIDEINKLKNDRKD